MAFWRRYRGVYGPGRVWHNRFWDHVIRNQEDLNRHVDYIHYNPVRHGMVSRPFLYEFSSARNWLSRGYYQEDWGTAENPVKNGEFGE
jgi:putative transposase